MVPGKRHCHHCYSVVLYTITTFREVARRRKVGSKAPRSNRGGTIAVPWTFSYITLTLTQILKRHTVAPRAPRIHYENTRQGAEVALRSSRIGEGFEKQPWWRHGHEWT